MCERERGREREKARVKDYANSSPVFVFMTDKLSRENSSAHVSEYDGDGYEVPFPHQSTQNESKDPWI